MGATYSPAGHVLLSTAAAALSPQRLDAEAIIAERALGLRGISLVASVTKEAQGYVALQVNFQLELASRGEKGITAESKGDQSFEYANVDGQIVTIDPVAKRGAEALLRRPVPVSSPENAVIVW